MRISILAKNRIGMMTIVAVLLSLPSQAVGEDEQWGHLSGRFLLDGRPPHLADIAVTSDKKVLGDSLPDESLIVNQDNRGIANVVVYLLPDRSQELRVHPSYARDEKAKVRMVMKDGKITPRVILLRTSQTMVQVNDGQVAYSPNISFINNTPL